MFILFLDSVNFVVKVKQLFLSQICWVYKINLTYFFFNFFGYWAQFNVTYSQISLVKVFFVPTSRQRWKDFFTFNVVVEFNHVLITNFIPRLWTRCLSLSNKILCLKFHFNIWVMKSCLHDNHKISHFKRFFFINKSFGFILLVKYISKTFQNIVNYLWFYTRKSKSLKHSSHALL